MKFSYLAPAYALLLAAGAAAQAQSTWKPAHSHIETRWAKDISPANALPDYPRPQLVRGEWRNLNGVWEYQAGAAGDTLPTTTLSSKILVPYAVETAASGVMEHHDRLWYRRTFTAPASWKGKELILHFDAVDYEAEIFVNGKSVGVHKGGYEAFSYDVTPFLQGDGPQELVVRVFDPTEDGGQPRGKQTTKPGGIMYTPTTGIWQTVWMEPVSKTSIDNLKIVPDIDAQTVHLTVNTTDSAPGAKAIVTIKSGKSTIKTVTVDADKEQTIEIRKPKLWSPDSPFLYDLDVKLVAGGATTDEVGSYFGMRKISLGLDHGVQKMLLNNKFVFEIGPLDQGFWPESGYTPPTEEAMKADISTMKQLGFNMVRKHIKVEPARWYYWTDKMGLMVWQDMPSPNSYIDHAPPTDRAAFEKQLNQVVTTHWNSPSIIMWVIFNESQARYDTARLVGVAKTLDPSRLVDRDSGAGYETDGDTAVGDVDDVHSYPAPGVSGPSATQALACGEYGGLGFVIKGHTWKADGWGYATVPDPKGLEDTYGEFTALLKKFRDTNGLSAAVYTQITDVEIESNGLMTYDRILKCDPKQIALANHFEYPVPAYKEIVPTSEKAAQTWKYTTAAPAADWSAKTFNDADWKQGPGGFGHSAAAGNPVGTPWETSDIWLRRTFKIGRLSAADLKQLLVRNCHDEDIEVFINGVPAYAHDGYISNYENKPIDEKAIATLVPDADNVLAVHCRQTVGGQFIDVGLTERIPSK